MRSRKMIWAILPTTVTMKRLRVANYQLSLAHLTLHQYITSFCLILLCLSNQRCYIKYILIGIWNFLNNQKKKIIEWVVSIVMIIKCNRHSFRSNVNLLYHHLAGSIKDHLVDKLLTLYHLNRTKENEIMNHCQ